MRPLSEVPLGLTLKLEGEALATHDTPGVSVLLTWEMGETLEPGLGPERVLSSARLTGIARCERRPCWP